MTGVACFFQLLDGKCEGDATMVCRFHLSSSPEVSTFISLHSKDNVNQLQALYNCSAK
jgi:hypothetical protein